MPNRVSRCYETRVPATTVQVDTGNRDAQVRQDDLADSYSLLE
ncbi:hypothetical protein [Mycolicibacterium vaccae]